MPITHDVPEYTWVKLAQAASSLNVNHDAGGTCSLLKGGSVEVLGNDPEFGTLIRYSLPPGQQAAGALCPDQALVFMPVGVVDTWPAPGEVATAMANKSSRRSSAIKRILGQ